MKRFENALVFLLLAAICLVLLPVMQGLQGKATQNEARPAAAYTVDARNFEAGFVLHQRSG